MIVSLINVWKSGESQIINWSTISYHLQKSTHNEENSLMLNLSYKTPRIKHSKLIDINLDNAFFFFFFFFGLDTKGQGAKAKITMWDNIKLEKGKKKRKRKKKKKTFCTAKESIIKIKRQPAEWGKKYV